MPVRGDFFKWGHTHWPGPGVIYFCGKMLIDTRTRGCSVWDDLAAMIEEVVPVAVASSLPFFTQETDNFIN